MAIPIYACVAHGPYIITMDDEAVVNDLTNEAGAGGTAFAPFILDSPFDGGLDGGMSRLRRTTQHVHADDEVTVAITPYRDGVETGDTITRSLSTGDNPIVIAPHSSPATVHQVKVQLSEFTAAVELGKAQQFVVPKRSRR